VVRQARRAPPPAAPRFPQDPGRLKTEDMTGTHPEEQQPKEPPNRINPIAIIAGALASLSAAVVASYFGVAGTLIGTAVVSIVSSLTAALYAGLLGRTRGVVQRSTTVLHVLSDRADREPPAPAEGPGDRERPAPAEGPADAEPGRPEGGETAGRAGRAGGRTGGGPVGWPWRRSVVVVGVAVLIFAIAIGAVTGIEAAIKEPIATALGVRDRGQARTSVGVAVHRAGGSETTRRSTPSSTTQPPASSQPGQTPSTTEPGPSTTTGGTAPSSTAPSSTAPPTTAQPGPSTSSGTSGTP
jgi:hypothetical protein